MATKLLKTVCKHLIQHKYTYLHKERVGSLTQKNPSDLIILNKRKNKKSNKNNKFVRIAKSVALHQHKRVKFSLESNNIAAIFSFLFSLNPKTYALNIQLVWIIERRFTVKECLHNLHKIFFLNIEKNKTSKKVPIQNRIVCMARDLYKN